MQFMIRRKPTNRYRIDSIAMAWVCAVTHVLLTTPSSISAEPSQVNLFGSERFESGLSEPSNFDPGEIQLGEKRDGLIDTARFESGLISWPESTVIPTSAETASSAATSPSKATTPSKATGQGEPKRVNPATSAPATSAPATAAPATRVIVGMPQLAGHVKDELRLQPNVQLESGTGRTATSGYSNANAGRSSDAGQRTMPSRSMFLSRTPEDQQAIENHRIAASPSGVIREVSRDPFSLASRSNASPSSSYIPAGARGQMISSPSDLAHPIEELPPSILESDGIGEGFGTIHDGESVLYGNNSIYSHVEDPLTAGERANDSLLSPSRGEAAMDRMIHGVQRSVNRIRSTRQRVDAGLGSILVPNAPLVLDKTQPLHQYRIRTDFNYGNDFPDRSEYLWASPLKGPGYQGAIDTQEFAFMFEVGGDSASVQTEFSVRAFDAEFGGGHTGVGDIRITQKLKLFDGKRWQITQLMRVHTPTGNSAIGAGTGHVSMEPGVLMRWQQSCWTYWHGELEYRIPLGGDPLYSGDVLTYGFGVSSVWYETLSSAVIPTLELTSLNFLTGQKTGMLTSLPVDGESAMALHPGVRFAWDRGGDFGITDLGISSGIPISDLHYFDSFLRFELRFTH
ncbi:hypothetical protein Pla52o_29750 [Novipirellula galeiformis]|uniref:Uncharacterized protein n=1 Tax=Novipirellula galeiformis TaxID=2528004 RepID=A0A5C6CKT4_9BACT|nr:hypothetical protein [Novipirellula galeiformis]TWU23439.1 hypothetical protein Pla52o_29750 [Novipirellula galeiformis]